MWLECQDVGNQLVFLLAGLRSYCSNTMTYQWNRSWVNFAYSVVYSTIVGHFYFPFMVSTLIHFRMDSEIMTSLLQLDQVVDEAENDVIHEAETGFVLFQTNSFTD